MQTRLEWHRTWRFKNLFFKRRFLFFIVIGTIIDTYMFSLSMGISITDFRFLLESLFTY